MKTENQWLYELKRTWYVWEMVKAKSRIHDKTKARMKRQFQDAVLGYAAYLAYQQETAAKYAEYEAGLR